MARRRSLKDQHQAKAEELAKESKSRDFADKIPFLPKFDDGETRYLRILPERKYGLFFLDSGEDDEYENPQFPYAEVWKHFCIGKGNHSMPCPKHMSGEECPICEEVDSLYKSDDEDDKTYAGKIRPQHKVVFFVIWRGHEDDGPYLWELAPKWSKDIISILGNTDYDDEIDDPEDGHDLKVTRHGEDFNNTSYRIDAHPKSSLLCSMVEVDKGVEYDVLDDEKMREWMEPLPDITDFGKPFLTLEQLTLLFEEKASMSDFQTDSSTDFNSEKMEEEQKSSRKRRRRTT